MGRHTLSFLSELACAVPPESCAHDTASHSNRDGAATIHSEWKEKAKEYRTGGRLRHGIERQG